ncbi:hypothetical protein [Adhaeretor mobilis]|uniref:IRE (Iron responsive element)-like protein n=1 Tax=Adhaeretor mobilis TaxID=1930276 RepID=A0A517MU21_9BACT|nr:hypothetical protein [Adhaeretor mobilis]QDS98381.1 hypothetical protein HG15A2_16550 [Adhaeretor mobilis]
MNRRSSFYRKVGYGLAIAMLLVPIALLGAPAVTSQGNRGGKLAQLRDEYDLGQADLGEIDPASETIRLATLGMRGIAVTWLWNKANEYKKTEDWTALNETLRQLARLQPYFISFWRYQAWNITYNVSVEVDAVEDRYYYVKRGIDFLKEGIHYNRDSPYLLDEIGWFIGNKIGRADEHVLYRKLFKADDDFHPEDRPPTQRDNWLVSKTWYEKGVEAVDVKKQSLGQKNPTTFFEKPARSQISYADAIEEEGVFGRRAKDAWEKASELWNAFGRREMRASNGMLIRLADLERWEEEAQDLSKQLDTLDPGLPQRMLKAAQDSLTDEEKNALNVNIEERTPAQSKLADAANQRLNITYDKIAQELARTNPEKAAEARRLAGRVAEAATRARYISTNRDVVQYEFWGARAEFEQAKEVLEARKLAHDAEKAFAEGSPPEARKLYEQSFDLWATALDKHPEIEPDSALGGDIMEYIEKYNKVLAQLDKQLGDPEIGDAFPLWDIVDSNGSNSDFRDAYASYATRQADVENLPLEQRPLINPADAH